MLADSQTEAHKVFCSIFIIYFICFLWAGVWYHGVIAGDELNAIASFRDKEFFQAVKDGLGFKPRVVTVLAVEAMVVLFGANRFPWFLLSSFLQAAFLSGLFWLLYVEIKKNFKFSFFTCLLLIITPFNFFYTQEYLHGLIEGLAELFLVLALIFLCRFKRKANNGSFFATWICFSLCIFSHERFFALLPLIVLSLFMTGDKSKDNLSYRSMTVIITCILPLTYLFLHGYFSIVPLLVSSRSANIQLSSTIVNNFVQYLGWVLGFTPSGTPAIILPVPSGILAILQNVLGISACVLAFWSINPGQRSIIPSTIKALLSDKVLLIAAALFLFGIAAVPELSEPRWGYISYAIVLYLISDAIWRGKHRRYFFPTAFGLILISDLLRLLLGMNLFMYDNINYSKSLVTYLEVNQSKLKSNVGVLFNPFYSWTFCYPLYVSQFQKFNIPSLSKLSMQPLELRNKYEELSYDNVSIINGDRDDLSDMAENRFSELPSSELPLLRGELDEYLKLNPHSHLFSLTRDISNRVGSSATTAPDERNKFKIARDVATNGNKRVWFRVRTSESRLERDSPLVIEFLWRGKNCIVQRTERRTRVMDLSNNWLSMVTVPDKASSFDVSIISGENVGMKDTVSEFLMLGVGVNE